MTRGKGNTIGFSEKVLFRSVSFVISQDICRNVKVKHSFGEKGAADLYRSGFHFYESRALVCKPYCSYYRFGCGSFYFQYEERWYNVISEDKKVWAVELLKEKQRETGRLPKKEDFDEVTRSRIKAFLGPWPRALEAAGLKEIKPKNKKGKN